MLFSPPEKHDKISCRIKTIIDMSLFFKRTLVCQNCIRLAEVDIMKGLGGVASCKRMKFCGLK